MTIQALLRVPEAALRLRVSKQTIRNMIHSGDIGAIRVGRNFKVPESELQRLLIEGDTAKAKA